MREYRHKNIFIYVPPQGACMNAGWQQFFHTIPALKPLATRAHRSASADNTHIYIHRCIHVRLA